MKNITANMAGAVFKVLVQDGEMIEVGQVVVVLESMKMEIPIEAMVGGKVEKILVQPGDFVNEGDILIKLE